MRFPDYRRPYDDFKAEPNVVLFKEQVEAFRQLLIKDPPTKEQAANVAYMLDAGELFTLIAYAQLLLEGARLHAVDRDLVDQMFDVLLRDFSKGALHMVLSHGNTPSQEQRLMGMIHKPAVDQARFDRVWESHVFALRGQCSMNP